jgi:hypothetical protein
MERQMKNMMKVIAGAVALAMPIASNAQTATASSVSVTVNSRPFSTGATGYSGAGGGHYASFTVNLGNGPRTFTQYLLWCIDNDRGVTIGQTYNYDVYTLANYAASSLGNLASPGPAHDPDLGDMKSIASLYDGLSSNWGTLTSTQKRNYQGSIWSEFEGFTDYNGNAGLGAIMVGDRNFNTNDYYVFSSSTNNRQTFLAYIPEPSSAVVLLAGMAGLMVAVRRRNTLA